MQDVQGSLTVEQKWPDSIVLVRHGESERNARKEAAKAAGSSEAFGLGLRDVDTPLTERGRQQARATGERFAADGFDVVFVSPYLRTRQTADEILGKFLIKPAIVMDERLREIEFGVLDGLTWDGVRAEFSREYARREREGKYWYRPPGGESRPDVALRVHSFLGTLTRDYRQKRVLIVCHSVVVLIFRRLLERWDETRYMQVDAEDDVKNCSITRYEWDQVRRKLLLKYYNAVAYSDRSAGEGL